MRTKRKRVSGVGLCYGERRDLPQKSPADWETERRACLARAWAQKAARENRAAREAVKNVATNLARKQAPESSDSDND